MGIPCCLRRSNALVLLFLSRGMGVFIKDFQPWNVPMHANFRCRRSIIAAFFYIPISEIERNTALELFNALSAEEQEFARKQFSFFWSYFFSSLLNTLSLMVHGAKLTSLVPQAINGDDVAFLKAVQIDRMLLLHHPYFIERKKKAQDMKPKAKLVH